MPTKTQLFEELKRLQAENEALREENAALCPDRAYGGLTRPALEVEHRKNVEECQYVVYIDLNKIHDLNTELGEPRVDEMIHSAFSFAVRDEDLVLFGRWQSGDEEAFLIQGNPDGFSERLHENLKTNGLSGMSAYAKILDGDLLAAVEIARKQVKELKRARGISPR